MSGVCVQRRTEAAKDERRQNENSSAAGGKPRQARWGSTRGAQAQGEGEAEGCRKSEVRGDSGVVLFFLTLKAIKYVGQEGGRQAIDRLL